MILKKNNYIVNSFFLFLVVFFTVILFVQNFTGNTLNGIILLSILLVFLIVSLIDLQWAVLLFVFFIPLYHVIGLLFGISRFLTITSMFLGCLFGGIVYLTKKKKFLIDFNLRITKPIIIFTIFITISFLFVYLRIYDYLSFYKHYFRDYIINVNLLSSGHGFSMAIYQYMNYLCGFLFLFLLTKIDISRKFLVKLFYTLFAANSIVFLSILYQVFVNPYFMGQSTWIGKQGWISSGVYANRYGSTLIDPNSLGIYSILILLAFIAFSYYFKIRSKIIISTVAIIECLVLLMLSGSRTGLSGLLVIILVYLFMLVLN